MQAFYTCFMKFCLTLNSYKFLLTRKAKQSYSYYIRLDGTNADEEQVATVSTILPIIVFKRITLYKVNVI